MPHPKAARWLDLIAYLLAHRYPVTREQVFQSVAAYREDWETAGEGESALESLRRKFERDKDELRQLGIEIKSVPMPQDEPDDPNVAYRLKPADFYLPYLQPEDAEHHAARPARGLKTVSVSESDAALLDRATSRVAQLENTPLGECARSARHKLGFDLPLSERAIERVLSGPMSGETTEVLQLLQGAVAAGNAVKCRYYSIGRDSEEEREVEPYGLLFNWSTWYCVARCRERRALRVFRVNRMSSAKLVKGRDATFEVPVEFSIRDYVSRAPWELSESEPTVVRARFEFPDSRWVLAQSVGEVVDPLLDDGGAVLEFRVSDSNPFLRWLLTFRSQVSVLEPESVARDLVELRKRVAALYEHEVRRSSK